MIAEAISREYVSRDLAGRSFSSATFFAQNDASEDEAGGDTLEDAVRDEVELPRERLRVELGREPNDEEVKEWLRHHTEGY